jgi:hypothetical protein
MAHLRSDDTLQAREEPQNKELKVTKPGRLPSFAA